MERKKIERSALRTSFNNKLRDYEINQPIHFQQHILQVRLCF